MIDPTPYNSTQLALLRSENQRSQLYLAVLDAPQVFACQINQTFATHDMVAQAAYDNPVGNYADVLPGQTALIGSAAGLSDLGICRIRKPLTSNQLYFGETSEIAWANNLHVTVVDDMGLWARHIRIVDDVPLMDYDIAFTNQHSVCDPVPVLGPHAVAWLEDGEASVQFDAGPSWVIGSSISAYAWSVSPAAGISISNPASATPTFTISQPGTYRVRCLVTAANGASFAGYRYIFAFDDEHPAFSEFGLKSCLGDDETGGWNFKVATLTQALQPGQLVILFERAMYGNQAGSVGTIAGRENILATGWVSGFDDKENDPEQDGYTFDIQGAHWWLKQMPVFPFGLELKNGTPASWTEMQGLTVDKALWHLLHWRSTATAIMDVVLTGDTRYARELSAVAGTLWEQIETLAKASIIAQPFVNQFGQLFVKIPLNLTPVASRAGVPNILDIQPGDRAKSLSLPRARQAKVAQLDLLGVAVSSAGSGSAYRSLANGNVPRRTGSKTIRDNLLLGSQAQSNELAGLLMADMNNPYPSIPVRFKANLRGFDMAPPMTASISLPDYAGKIIPRRVEYRHNETTGKLDVEVEFRAETTGTLSVTGTLPQGAGTGGSIIMPPLPPPPLPPAPPSPPPAEPELNFFLKGLYLQTTGNRILACGNLLDGVNQVWADVTPDGNPGLNTWQSQVDWISGSFYICSSDKKKYYRCTPAQVYGGGLSFPFKVQEWFVASDYDAGGGSPSENLVQGLGINPATGEAVIFVANLALEAYESGFATYIGSIDNLSYAGLGYLIGNMVDRGNPVTTIGNGKIIVTYHVNSFHGGKFKISTDGTTFRDPSPSIPYVDWFDWEWHVRPNPIENLLYYGAKSGISHIGKSTNLGDGATSMPGFKANYSYQAAIEPLGQKIASTINGRRIISLDGGATWDEEAVADNYTGEKIGFVWAGYDDDDNDLWLTLCRSDPYLSGSKDTIYASVDDCQTYAEVGQALKQALIQGGMGVDSTGNPIEKPVRMWAIL